MHHTARPLLEKFFSRARLNKFSTLSGSDNFADCLNLYHFNIKCSEKFHTALSQFEIILRNAINEQLIESYGSEWFLDKSLFLLERQKELLRDATNHLREKNKEINSCNITANLTFGFWVNLFNPDYDKTLWRNSLSNVFSGHDKKPSRGLVCDRLKNLIALETEYLTANQSSVHDYTITTIRR